MKIKTGDEVLVIAGKDKGSKGTVLAVFEDRNKVIVEGVNRMKRHVRKEQNSYLLRASHPRWAHAATQ